MLVFVKMGSVVKSSPVSSFTLPHPPGQVPGSFLPQPDSFPGLHHGPALQGRHHHLPTSDPDPQVTSLGAASVSWVRLAGPSSTTSYLTVLSSGPVLFSSSPRLALLHAEGSPDWTLQISEVQASDGGTYECQANTEPKAARTVHVTVTKAGPYGPGPALALQGEEAPSHRPQRTTILSPEVVKPQPGDTVGPSTLRLTPAAGDPGVCGDGALLSPGLLHLVTSSSHHCSTMVQVHLWLSPGPGHPPGRCPAAGGEEGEEQCLQADSH